MCQTFKILLCSRLLLPTVAPPPLFCPLQQARAEQEEEFISNTLFKKIQALQKEKETLAVNYEKEEEFLTNELSRKLMQVSELVVYWGLCNASHVSNRCHFDADPRFPFCLIKQHCKIYSQCNHSVSLVIHFFLYWCRLGWAPLSVKLAVAWRPTGRRNYLGAAASWIQMTKMTPLLLSGVYLRRFLFSTFYLQSA